MAKTKLTRRKRPSVRTPSPETPLKRPAVFIESLEPTHSSPSPPPPQKRSIRAASIAIAKREEIKRLNEDISPVSSSIPSEEKKPTIKKRRKLNAKKVVMVPNSTSSTDDLGLEDTPVDSYAKYLNPKQGHVAPIVIDVKKRKIRKRDTANNGSPTTVGFTNNQDHPLDLSNHSIIPNGSFIEKFSSKHKASITTNTSNEDSEESNEQLVRSESEDEFFDALSEFDDGHEAMQDVMYKSMASV